jgi:hypothetical protein
VTVSVQSACDASTRTSAFGTYPAAGSTLVSVNCTLPTAYDVRVSADLTKSAAPQVTGLAKTLASYKLLPGSMHILAGDRAAEAESQSADTHAAWSQGVASGAFADSVTVTITY